MVVQKRGDNMVRTGRPTNSRKDIRLQIRVDKETADMLDCCSEEKNISRSDVVREGIRLVYAGIKK